MLSDASATGPAPGKQELAIGLGGADGGMGRRLAGDWGLGGMRGGVVAVRPATQAATAVSGTSTPFKSLVIDPSSNPTDGSATKIDLVRTVGAFVQLMPVTETVNQITVGDFGTDPSCKSPAKASLSVRQASSGNLVDVAQIAVSKQSVAFPVAPGRLTFSIPATRLFKGYALPVQLSWDPSGCRYTQERTWAHNGATVNAGPALCPMMAGTLFDGSPPGTWRMWHVAGASDKQSCVNYPTGFDPSMPGGWLMVVNYNGYDSYVRNNTVPPPQATSTRHARTHGCRRSVAWTRFGGWTRARTTLATRTTYASSRSSRRPGSRCPTAGITGCRGGLIAAARRATFICGWIRRRRRRWSRSTSGRGSRSDLPYFPRCSCGDPVDSFTGNFTESQSDLHVGGLGLPLEQVRTYNSLAATAATSAGALGYGWSGSFRDQLKLDQQAHTATISHGDGRTVTFYDNGDGTYAAPPWEESTLVKNGDLSYTYTLPDRTATTSTAPASCSRSLTAAATRRR